MPSRNLTSRSARVGNSVPLRGVALLDIGPAGIRRTTSVAVRDGLRATRGGDMFSETASFYDLLYSTFKDYAAEASAITDLLHRVNPRCESVLDVGCGSGEHARLLARQGYTVDGLDLDPAFVQIAQQKHPDGRFVVADMSDFELGRTYDAVLCLFSSIGYLKTLDRVVQALTCFRRHLAPGGCAIVEPWFPPGGLDPLRVAHNTGEANGVRVTRVSRVRIDGRLSRLLFDYEITDSAGTRQASEIHELGLFTTQELSRAFTDAGLVAEYDPDGLTSRGLFVARRQ